MREEGAQGGEPKAGTNESLNVDSNGKSKAKSRERHGVAEAGAGRDDRGWKRRRRKMKAAAKRTAL